MKGRQSSKGKNDKMMGFALQNTGAIPIFESKAI